jgi:thymidylate kinase
MPPSCHKKKLFLFFRMKNCPIVQILQHEYAAWYLVCAGWSDTRTLYFVHPDICGDYFRAGRLLLPADKILSNRVNIRVDDRDIRDVSVPSPRHGFIYYLLKKVDKGLLDSRHSDYLSAEWAKDPAGCERQLHRFWVNADVNLIAKAANDNNWAIVRTDLSRLQKSLDVKLRFSFKHRTLELIRIARRILRPTGLLVVFLGSDGVGKSTVIKIVSEELAPAFRKTKIYHLRPFFGQPLGDICNPDPQKNPQRGIPSSLAKLLLWWADYTIGYLMEIFPKKVRSTLVLFDRYYHDILVDHRRYRYGGPIWLARVLARLISQPDIFILLDAPPEIVHSRKQEVTFEETRRQRIAYVELIGELKCAHLVNAAKPVDQVVNEVEKIILSYMDTRTTRWMDIQ